MKVNLKAIIAGFAVTLILIPFLNALAPLIGGIIVGYIVGGNYRDGIISGGLSVSLAALTYAIIVNSLFKDAIITKATSTHLSVEMVIILSIILAIIGGVLLGLIGGIIGVTIKNRYTQKR
jgi:Family of unknown function (DUF5518)